MHKLSRNDQYLVAAYEKGYRVADNGSVISPSGRSLRLVKAKSNGRFHFSINHRGKIRGGLSVHRLAAYQKFGDKIFQEGLEVRHLDSNETNNRLENIAIGTHSDNLMDMPEAQRLHKAFRAAKKRRKLSGKEARQLRKDRENGATYKELMERYGIAKGTVSYIVNRRTYANE